VSGGEKGSGEAGSGDCGAVHRPANGRTPDGTGANGGGAEEVPGVTEAPAGSGGHGAAEVNDLLQFREFGFGGDKNGDVGIGVFPKRYEGLILGAGFLGIAGKNAGAREA